MQEDSDSYHCTSDTTPSPMSVNVEPEVWLTKEEFHGEKQSTIRKNFTLLFVGSLELASPDLPMHSVV